MQFCDVFHHHHKCIHRDLNPDAISNNGIHKSYLSYSIYTYFFLIPGKLSCHVHISDSRASSRLITSTFFVFRPEQQSTFTVPSHVIRPWIRCFLTRPKAFGPPWLSTFPVAFYAAFLPHKITRRVLLSYGVPFMMVSSCLRCLEFWTIIMQDRGLLPKPIG